MTCDIPLVSIAMPIYKPNLLFFREALKSIHNQTYKSIELVISCNSKLIEDEVITEINNINWKDFGISLVVISCELKGIFNNLNHCLKNCSAEYIQIFCQDDIMYPTFIENQINLFQKNKNLNLGLVFSQFDRLSDKSQFSKLGEESNYRLQWSEIMTKTEAIQNLFKFGCMPGNLSPVMLKTDVVRQLGGFDQNYSYAGDFEYWVRVAKCFSFGFNKEAQLAIRNHDSQASNILKISEVVLDVGKIYSNMSSYLGSIYSNNYKSWYIIQVVGVQYFYRNIRGNLMKFKIKEFILTLKYLNSYPYSLLKIIIFFLLSFNGRIRLLNI